MLDTDKTLKHVSTGEHAADARPALRLRVIDWAVVAFIIATLVLMPILVSGPDTASARSDAADLSPQARESLADSRGDAAASAVLDKANKGGESEAAQGKGMIGVPVDAETREAIDEASRGDAAANGSVSSNNSGGVLGGAS